MANFQGVQSGRHHQQSQTNEYVTAGSDYEGRKSESIIKWLRDSTLGYAYLGLARICSVTTLWTKCLLSVCHNFFMLKKKEKEKHLLKEIQN